MATQAGERRVVIIGAGYAGMTAALRLGRRARRLGGAVTLVNGTDTFVERIRLHQFGSGQTLKMRRIPAMLRGTGVQFVQGRVTALNPNAHRLSVSLPEGNSLELGYDTLLYALGSTIDVESVPGVREQALALSSPELAARLASELPALAARGGRLLVCGGGLTGIEAATEIAEAWPGARVALTTRDTLGERLSKKGRAHLRRVFARLGIELHEGASVARLAGGRAELAGGGTLPFDLCLWAGSFSVPALAWEAGLRVNERGQILVGPDLRSVSHPEIVAAGDAASPAEDPGAPIRMACATAMPMGAFAADTILADLAGRTAPAFSYRYLIQCISLGRKNGLIQFVNPDDSPREKILTGRAAALVKEFICRFTTFSLAMERRRPGTYRWTQSRQPSVATRTASRQARLKAGAGD
ncbi:MAG TPA: FAD-dependent oxidoreductase [Dehalococcoidia bacterium]